ncbi:RNA-binding protein [Halobellus clavatus]|jgi:PUA domain protein|uniref:RNA-binding protein, containing PUA domain n=1 Tax=Halobellus clavatus TaxID=660517 RepID=A0A1H3EMS0_9EURY|nr:RNA-binding protein [Halobellus clavatus]SDX80093.1 RNA-binding protein, containing PUA domain [Halobellus clavatus]
MQVKSRHHLRADEIDDLETEIESRTGVELDGDTYEMVELGDEPFDVVLVDGDPDVVRFDAGPDADAEAFLTVQGANRHGPSAGVVTVDAGAISFVSDGADVMRPGIVEADDDVAEGDLVTIAEETHGKVLAIGRALVDGEEMPGDAGKVVDSIHHVGDDLFEFAV